MLIDEEFIVELLDDIVNDRCDTSLFSQMEVIPIYKTAKKLDPQECNA
jgi:hypothetical protein